MLPRRILLSLSLVLATGTAPAAMVYMLEREGESQIYIAGSDGRDPEALTSGARTHLYPDISADANRVAYVEGPDRDHLGIVTRDLGTGEGRRWTGTDGVHLHPDLSGDGQHLAFSGPLGPDGEPRIGIIDVTGHGAAQRSERAGHGQQAPKRPEPQVIESDHPCYFPALSSDGGFVVFQRSKGESRALVQYRRASGERRLLTDENGKSMSPALSFDDAHVAYTSERDGNWDIYVQDLRTGEESRLTRSPARDFAPAFRPDGSLAFASDRGGHFELYELAADVTAGGQATPEPLITGPGAHYAPAVSGHERYTQRRLPPMNEPARSSFGVARVGERIYVAGGHRGPEHRYPRESFLSRMAYFDLDSKTWHTVSPRPVAAQGFDLAARGKYIYAFGGFTYSEAHEPHWQSIDLIHRYDTEEDAWEQIGHLPRPRSSYVAARVGDRVYLVGGWNSTPLHEGDKEGQFHRAIDVFDLQTETAEVSSYEVPEPLRRALSSVVIGDRIILIGGITQGSSRFNLIDNVTALNTETGQWQERTPLPFATFAPATGTLGQQIFMFGGMRKQGSGRFDYVNHVYTLPEPSASWEHTGRYLSRPRGFSQVVPLPGQALGLLGGHSYVGGDGPVRAFEAFGIEGGGE